jgi:hypothetical protein
MMWGLVAGVVGGGLGPLVPAVRRVASVPSAWLLHAMVMVATLAARVPVTVDARALSGLASLGALTAALWLRHRARREAIHREAIHGH